MFNLLNYSTRQFNYSSFVNFSRLFTFNPLSVYIYIYVYVYYVYIWEITWPKLIYVLKESSELTGVRLIFLAVFSRNSYEPKNARTWDVRAHTQRTHDSQRGGSVDSRGTRESVTRLPSFLSSFRRSFIHTCCHIEERGFMYICTVHEREQARKIEKERDTVTHRHMRSLLHWYAYLGRTQWTADAWRYAIVHGWLGLAMGHMCSTIPVLGVRCSVLARYDW